MAAKGQGGHAGQRPPPLYPSELQPGQAYAVQVGPGTYVIHHPADGYGHPAARRGVPHRAARHRSAHAATPRPRRTHANRALIEELRRRAARRAARLAARRAAKHAAARKRAATRAADKTANRVVKRAVHKADKAAGRKPDEIVHTRKVVHDKPLVIVTRRVVDDPPKVITRRHYVDDAPAGMRDVEPRVIHADAEITILGPDRMSIRLVRKQGEPLVIGDAAAGPGKPKHPKHTKRFKTRK